MVVEPDFTDRAYGRGRGRLIAHQIGRALRVSGKLMRLVRVHSDRYAHVRPHLLDAPRLRRLGVVPGFEDNERAFHARVPCAPHHIAEIGGERLVGEMAVAVDHDAEATRTTTARASTE